MRTHVAYCLSAVLRFFAVFIVIVSPVDAADDRIKESILKAGNTDSDAVRLSLLRQLRENAELDASVAEDLDKLIFQINRWQTEKQLNYFSRQARSDLDFDFGIDKDSPLEPLTWLYRGRMVIWYAMESGSVWNNPQRKRQFMSAARDFFTRYSQAYQENRIAKMYLGEPIASGRTFSPSSNAPEWAIHQRAALERLADIIEWWIDHRMQQDGQFGGGWGDDCEMWRWQAPILIGFENPKINRAQHRFSNAMMSQDHMKLGFTTRMTDVEHTAEDSADVITPMMHLDPDNEQWQGRALKLAEYMENLWTGRNQRKQLQFKSTYFTANRVDGNSQRACDTVYHPRAVQPALLYWQRTRDAKLTRLFSTWMDTWVLATARAERGKAAGIIPVAIHWPDGNVGGVGPDWWDPRNHGEHTLYLWPSAMGMMTNTMLLTYHNTGDEKYLEPIRSMASAQLRYLKKPTKNPKPGSEAWCAMRMDFLADTVAKYRFLTGSEEFDELLKKSMSSYMRFRMEGNRRALVESLEQTAESMAINFEGYTSEVRYTDRVLRFPGLFEGEGIVSQTPAPIYQPDTSLLYSTVTGDPGSVLYFPLNAVRWLTPSRNIAALVVDSGATVFEAQLFNFSSEKRPMSAELYLLEKGPYTWNITIEEAGTPKVILEKPLIVRGSRTRIAFELPANKLCTLEITAED